jgi:hypothetical protein
MGKKTSEIAKTLDITTNCVIKYLNKPTADWTPPETPNSFYYGYQSAVLRLCHSLGITPGKASRLLNIPRGTGYRRIKHKPMGCPSVLIRITKTLLDVLNQPIAKGEYHAYSSGNKTILLKHPFTQAIHEVTTQVIAGYCKLVLKDDGNG